MGQVKRIYVEKKAPYAVRAKELKEEVRQYLGITALRNVRVLIRYDVENLSDATYQQALMTVFSEPPVDDYYEETFEMDPDAFCFSVEYLPGQFDQRADSAEQCVKLLNEKEDPVIRSATTYVFEGEISGEDRTRIKEYCINPVDSRETDEQKPDTLVQKFDEPADVAVFDGFQSMPEAELKELYASLNLAMTFKDFLHIQKYFAGEEKRDPSVTEIRVLDTYWSDHCRHTTFLTELKNVTFDDGYYKKPIENTYQEYYAAHKEMFAGRDDKFVSLMDIALLAMRQLKKAGKLDDMEESDEINACSIVVPVEIDGKEEEWLVFFKNETHNHPTEIEPFGGAATCLGGAIRDPLSGRGYVYQAMRVTGAADPTVSMKDTLPGKLPQRKITTGAAHGYSSYGNQIGLATGLVNEVYHPNYVAKRMEIGAVMGAAPDAMSFVKTAIRAILSFFWVVVPDAMVSVVLQDLLRHIPQSRLMSVVQRFRRVMLRQSERSSVCSAARRSALLLRSVTISVPAVCPLPSVSWQMVWRLIWTRCQRNMPDWTAQSLRFLSLRSVWLLLLPSPMWIKCLLLRQRKI